MIASETVNTVAIAQSVNHLKLSKLQKFILKKGYENRFSTVIESDKWLISKIGRPAPVKHDIRPREVLFHFYNFPGRPDHLQSGGKVQVFKMASIGELRYRSAAAAVSRALKRLEDRGLVTRWRDGSKGAFAELTDEGLRVGKELMLNTLI